MSVAATGQGTAMRQHPRPAMAGMPFADGRHSLAGIAAAPQPLGAFPVGNGA